MAQVRADERRSIQQLATGLAALELKKDSAIDLVGRMAGALYALDRAADLCFDDARATPNPTEFADEFRATLRAIGAGTAVPPSWLAGFYYVSALERLHSLNQRIPHLRGRPGSLTAEQRARQEQSSRTHGKLAAKLRDIVEDLKHAPGAAHIGKSWDFKFGEALQVATYLCGLLEQRLSSPL